MGIWDKKHLYYLCIFKWLDFKQSLTQCGRNALFMYLCERILFVQTGSKTFQLNPQNKQPHNYNRNYYFLGSVRFHRLGRGTGGFWVFVNFENFLTDTNDICSIYVPTQPIYCSFDLAYLCKKIQLKIKQPPPPLNPFS